MDSKFARFRKKKSIRFTVLSTRIFLGIIFLAAGLSKLIDGFPGIIGPTWLEEELAQYGLVFFARFVAISEAIVGALLLTQRFATLGAVMLFPMQACILMVTVSLSWQGTPYVNTFLLLLNAGLLLYDWPKLKFILTDRVESIEKLPFERKAPILDNIWLMGMASFVIGLLLLGSVKAFEYVTYAGAIVMLIIPVAAKWKAKQKAANR